MKSIFTKISSALLAFLVLFSTLSFTVESHYCGGFLMDISIVGEANDCGMKVEQKMAKEKINCCKDEVIITDGQDELHPASFGTLNFEKQQFLTTFYSSYLNLLKKESSRNIIYKAFHRPVIPINYQIKYQSFLI
tara:strand:+ start:398 stop:802 length:405 start_codon:yes stop_codon:yes gene_type:complete